MFNFYSVMTIGFNSLNQIDIIIYMPFVDKIKSISFYSKQAGLKMVFFWLGSFLKMQLIIKRL